MVGGSSCPPLSSGHRPWAQGMRPLILSLVFSLELPGGPFCPPHPGAQEIASVHCPTPLPSQPSPGTKGLQGPSDPAAQQLDSRGRCEAGNRWPRRDRTCSFCHCFPELPPDPSPTGLPDKDRLSSDTCSVLDPFFALTVAIPLPSSLGKWDSVDLDVKSDCEGGS